MHEFFGKRPFGRQRWLGIAALIVSASVTLTACEAPTGSFETTVVPKEAATSPKTNELVNLADATKASGDPAGASALYERVLQDHPELTKVRTSLGETMLDQNDPALALRYFKEAQQRDPSDIQNLIGAGQAHLAKHEPRSAQKMFETALQIDPSNIVALNGLGVAQDSLGRHEEAQATYRKALAIDAANAAVRNNFGLSFALSGKFDEAISELSPLEKDPGAVGRKARQNLSLTYAMRGDFTTAAKYGKVDLKEEDVRNDLHVYGSIRQD
jgi:Flp pilus assembly protein TadD